MKLLLSANALAVMILCSCGGQVDDGLFPDAAGGAAGDGSDTGGSTSGGGAKGGAPGADGGTGGSEAGGGEAGKGSAGKGGDAGKGGGGGFPVTCDEARADYDSLVFELTQCSPFENLIQCHLEAPGVCCPHSVSSQEQVEKLTWAVDTVRKVCDAIPCPATVCPEVPSGHCEPLSGVAPGRCF